MMKITKLILLLFCCMAGFAQADPGATRERIYIQTDKELYLAGETVLLKAILTDSQGVPGGLSKVAYVELLGEDAAKAEVKIALNDSQGSAYLRIPSDLPTNTYRLVGYTRVMRNEGNEIFFEKELPIINTLQQIVVSNDSLNIHQVKPKAPNAGNIRISSDRKEYSAREQGTVTIENLPEDIWTLSVSIAGNDLSEINYPTHITHWKSNLSRYSLPPFSGEFLPEYEGHVVRGKLQGNGADSQSGSENPLVIPFLSVMNKEIRLFSGTLNEQDEVGFITKRINNFQTVATAVFDESGRNAYRIDLLSPFAEHDFKTLQELSVYESQLDNLQKRHVALQTPYLFVPSVEIEQDTLAAYFQWQPDIIYDLDEYTRFSTMEDVAIEILFTVRFHKVYGKRLLQVLMKDEKAYIPVPTLVLLDGIPILEHEEIFAYNPDNLKKVEIYRERFVFGDFYCNGIIHFISKNNDLANFNLNPTTQLLSYEMPQENVTFIAPDYSKEEIRKSPLPDFRHTLLWQPNVNAGNGKTVAIPFWTSDYMGDFRIKVEGLTSAGEVVYAEESFVVQ